MLGLIRQALSTDVGIDLGTANTLVFRRDEGVVVREPSVVAVKGDSRRVLGANVTTKVVGPQTIMNVSESSHFPDWTRARRVLFKAGSQTS